MKMRLGLVFLVFASLNFLAGSHDLDDALAEFTRTQSEGSARIILKEACTTGNMTLITLLLSNNLLLTNDTFNCIHFMASSEEIPMESVKYLLQQRLQLNYNALTANTEHALHFAARINRWDIAQRLLYKKDITPNIFNGKGLSPLMLAIQHGSLTFVKGMLANRKVEKDLLGPKNISILSMAVLANELEILKALLDHGGCSFNLDLSGLSPFHYAASKDNVEAMKLLLDHHGKESLSLLLSHEPNCFQMAANNNAIAMMKLLISQQQLKGTEEKIVRIGINSKYPTGDSLVYKALEREHLQLVHILLQSGLVIVDEDLLDLALDLDLLEIAKQIENYQPKEEPVPLNNDIQETAQVKESIIIPQSERKTKLRIIGRIADCALTILLPVLFSISWFFLAIKSHYVPKPQGPSREGE